LLDDESSLDWGLLAAAGSEAFASFVCGGAGVGASGDCTFTSGSDRGVGEFSVGVPLPFVVSTVSVRRIAFLFPLALALEAPAAH